MIIDSIKRTFKVLKPQGINDSVKLPLVFVLHGYQNEVKELGTYTGFDNLASKAGFIVVYPQGTINENGYYIWNAGGIYEEWTRGSDDVKFIDSVVHFMEANFFIDTQKIFIVGHSNGSMMAYRLAAELSDQIRAIACVSGPMLVNGPSPIKPVAVMHIHGDADMVVPHTGTQMYGFKIPAIDDVFKKWIEWDSCSAVPSVLTYNPQVTALGWKGKTEIRLYLIHDLGHDWPSNERGGWPATDYIWDFFKTVSKN
jgi:polyhydroxybutyrate depolymerase